MFFASPCCWQIAVDCRRRSRNSHTGFKQSVCSGDPASAIDAFEFKPAGIEAEKVEIRLFGKLSIVAPFANTE
jgi:hypothetical protein